MSMLNQIKDFVANKITDVAQLSIKSPDNVLTWTYLATTIASSVCQILSIQQNKNISDEKKRFLIPQETIDAVVNAVLFFGFTKSLGDFGKSLVDNGKILPQKLITEVGKHCDNPEDVIKKVLSNEKVADTLESIIKKPITDYKAGVGVLFSVIGSITATCFVTPFVRNKLAAIIQKNKTHTEPAPVKPNETAKPTFDTGTTFNNSPAMTAPQIKTTAPAATMNEFLNVTKNHLYRI